MYHVHAELTPEGAKLIAIAGRDASGALVDGGVVLYPGDWYRGKPFDFWQLGWSYDHAFKGTPTPEA